ncbi:unnamed protein product [Tuber melanosporum]|uniref:Glutamyl-tRNA(Gln) amidotransferase subunit B, mitochondrial n=1 Tax=Tuber melanosporum (strain Mel28) TaxID=656061 RepID=D5GKB1_TUBMM|nr:uncharacterized protein GSTUM_00009455001 [Tuber melanosporum]CAZ84954.1 unnamed protein product [Tuber melanosporum]
MPPRTPATAYICQSCLRTFHLRLRLHSIPLRRLTTTTTTPPSPETGTFRKDLKTRLKSERRSRQSLKCRTFPEAYVVTCGLEIHAQLNCARKLFSRSSTSISAPPNTHIAPFDAALPGSQPRLNKSVLLPALRAAIALRCRVNEVSRFDRKHYFYWDQPSGYQITQFYSALANDGHVMLYPHDTPYASSGGVRVPIRQVQLEQDTGKTIASANVSLVDLNRVGAGLVEIITAPFDIPGVAFASAVMKKLQATLRSVGACVVGMEWGGLRADVNVSVRSKGVQELGRRCEIKNLSSLKLVEEAITAEVERQVRILENGGVVEGETRGWDVEKGTTKRLRGKERGVDYRYMPDPDLGPVVIAPGVVESVRKELPLLPDEVLEQLTGTGYHLNVRDAQTLMMWDEGEVGVISYYKDVVEKVTTALGTAETAKQKKGKEVGKIVGNWLIHGLGGTLTTHALPWPLNPLTPTTLSSLITHLLTNKITSATAKSLLSTTLFSPSETRTVEQIIEQENLAIKALSEAELEEIVRRTVTSDDDDGRSVGVLVQLRGLQEDGGGRGEKRKGLASFFVGKVMKELARSVRAERVEAAVEKVLREVV